MVRRAAVAVAATVVTLLGSAAVAPTAAQASPVCDWYPRTNGEGHAITNQVTHIRTGPFAECGTNLVVTSGRKLYIWCQYRNEHGNWWIYGRLADTNIYGWVYSGNARAYIYDENSDGRIDWGRC